MDHRTIVSFFTCQLVWVNRYVFSTYIKKGKNLKYSMTNFKNEPQWARELIEQVESRYVMFRKRAAAISKVRRALCEYEKLLNRTHSDEV